MWLLLACHAPQPEAGPTEGEYGEILSETLVGGVADLVAHANHAYLCLEAGGLARYDVADPHAPDEQQRYHEDQPCRQVDIIGDRVFSLTDRAFRSFSLNNMMIRAEYEADYDLRALAADPGEGLIWLAGWQDGAVVVERVGYREDNPMSAQERVAVEGDPPLALASRPEGIFLLHEGGRLSVLTPDLDPLTTWDPPQPPDSLALHMGEHDYAYLSLGSAGLAVLDARDPSALAAGAAWQAWGATRGVLVIEDRLYAGLDGGLAVLDLADPAAPTPIGAEPIPLDIAPDHLWVDGGFGYVADSAAGVWVILNAE